MSGDMSSDEITPNDAAIELSDEELDEIAGGFNMKLTASRFSKSKFTFAPAIPSRARFSSAPSPSQVETTESAIIQLIITDATTEDLQVIAELFGDAAAIDGSD